MDTVRDQEQASLRAVRQDRASVSVPKGKPTTLYFKEVMKMTIREVCHQLYNLSVAGYFNREKFTETEITEVISDHFKYIPRATDYLLEISLPDGRWHMLITRYADKPDGFDYIIPDNREEETKLINAWCARRDVNVKVL